MSANPHQEADKNAVTAKKDPDVWTVSPKGFKIIWGGDNRYWKFIERSDRVEKQAVELVQVCWLELTGSISRLTPGKKYQIKFEMTMKEGAFGWNGCTVYLMAKIGKGGVYKHHAKLNLSEDIKAGETKTLPAAGLQIPLVSADAQDTELYFGLYEVWSGKWKGGLQIHGAVVEEV